MSASDRNGGLRILTFAWHVGHQYELFKLPHTFTLIDMPDFPVSWNDAVRPLSQEIEKVTSLDPSQYDLAIIPFDEHVLNPTSRSSVLSESWGVSFQRLLQWCREVDLPRILLCHGSVPRLGRLSPEPDAAGETVDQAELGRFREITKGEFVVCNSRQALEEWGFDGRAVTHGFDPDEYRPGAHRQGVLTIGGNLYTNRLYQGFDLFSACAQRVPIHLLGGDYDLEGLLARAPVESVKVPNPPKGPLTKLLYKRSASLRRRWARQKFRNYRELVGDHGILLNTTRYSPMPRSRSEAMLLGLAVVSTPDHDFAGFIEDGESGFLVSEPDHAIEVLEELIASPELRAGMGRRAREAAIEHFDIRRFLADWEQILASRLN